MTVSDRDVRQAIIDACIQMNELGINQGTSGNISCRHGEGMLISPTSTPYDTLQPEDIVFSSHGVNVIVDPKSLAYLDGTEMDFVKEGLNEGFKFRNPNQKGECGCGESFTV